MKETILSALLLFMLTGILGELTTFDLRKDFFNIYKGIAVETKKITHTNTTRDEVTFHMYRNYGTPLDSVLNDSNLYLMNSTKDHIIFLTHGWASNAESWVLDLKDAFLYRYPKSTVITVDWKLPANQFYFISSINTYDVGNFIGDMILRLITQYNVDLSSFILVGHSLGAHVCGFAGKLLKQSGLVLPRIIGLDPAGPLFDIRPFEKRLNPSDAEVVEIVHSDTGSFGFKMSCGTIDFYPNGGDAQNGCTRIDLADITSFIEPITCDHARSYLYFMEAVRFPNHFEAAKCQVWTIFQKVCDYNDIVHLGDLTTTKTGDYYFETNRDIPYSRKLIPEENLLGRISKIFSFNKN